MKGMAKASGGYLAIEKSTAKHKQDEINAVSILAGKGYKVILKNEAGLGMNVKTPDGYVYSASFEQRTPTKDAANTIRNALTHAQSKNADVALIFSKNHIFSRKTVEEGVSAFEDKTSYRFKQIIIVADNGHVHRHKHNA